MKQKGKQENEELKGGRRERERMKKVRKERKKKNREAFNKRKEKREKEPSLSPSVLSVKICRPLTLKPSRSSFSYSRLSTVLGHPSHPTPLIPRVCSEPHFPVSTLPNLF
jgi:hypothetical protein